MSWSLAAVSPERRPRSRCARGGRDVIILEAQPRPVHKVCGEFLSGEALEDLHALGVDVAALGAVRLRRVRLALRDGVKEVTLPFAAMSLTRRTLDEALLQAAVQEGVKVRRACRVTGMVGSTEGGVARAPWEIAFTSGSTLQALEVVLASGKHDLPGCARPAGEQRGLLGLKMYYRLSPEQAAELEECIELLVYPGGYAGLQPVEEGVANFCCVLTERGFSKTRGTLGSGDREGATRLSASGAAARGCINVAAATAGDLAYTLWLCAATFGRAVVCR